MARNDARAAGYGMPGAYIPGNDPIAIFDVAGEAVARARAGGGPTLIEIETYRLAGHFMGDAEGYRPKGEKDALFARDPIPALRRRLIAEGDLSEAEAASMEAAAHATVDEAIAFARSSPYPAAEEALERVFV